MSSRRARVVALACVLASALALVGSRMRAQERGEGPLVLRLPTSTRALAMGNAPLAATDGDAIFANPAMLRAARGATFSLQRYGDHATLGAQAAVLAVGPVSLGLGARFLDWRGSGAWGDAVRGGGSRLALGGDSLASSLALSSGAALHLGPVDLGLGVHVVRETYGGDADDALFLDVGAALPMGPTTLSVVVQHLGGAPMLGNERGQTPWRAGIGFGGTGLPVTDWIDLGALMQVTLEPGFVRPAGGVELLYVPLTGVSLAARGGFRLPRETDESLIIGGLGATLDRVSLDYAFEPFRDGRSAHRIALRIR